MKSDFNLSTPQHRDDSWGAFFLWSPVAGLFCCGDCVKFG